MKDLSKYIGLASLIAVLVASADLYGYWRAFGVNPLPSLSFQQLIAMSTIPLLSTLGLGTTYSIAIQLFVNSPAYQTELDSMGQNRRLRYNILLLLFAGISTVLVTVLRFSDGHPAWWLTIAFWFPFLYVELSRRKLVIPLPTKNRLEILALYFIFTSFVNAYASGISEAHELKKPGTSNNAIMTLSGKEVSVKLVGRLGDQFYVLGTDKAISMIPVSEIKKIRFRPGLRIRP